MRSAFKSHFRFVGAAHHNRSARQRLYVQAQKRRRGGQVARGRPPFRAATRRAAFEEPQASSLTSTNSKGGCLAHFRSRCVHGRRRSGVLRLRVEVGAGAQRPQPARPGTIQAANFLHHSPSSTRTHLRNPREKLKAHRRPSRPPTGFFIFEPTCNPPNTNFFTPYRQNTTTQLPGLPK